LVLGSLFFFEKVGACWRKFKLLCNSPLGFLFLQAFVLKRGYEFPSLRSFKVSSKISHSKNKTPLKLQAFFLGMPLQALHIDFR
jgi:hypothetical protein